MTAVAPPLGSFQSSRWTSSSNDFGSTNSDEVVRMFAPGPRKTAQRQNSSSSIASTASSTSTLSANSAQANGGAVQVPAEAGSWATRKKPTRAGLWPPGKAEPATGLSTARPQTVNSVTSGPTASSAISALHAPLLPTQQMANGAVTANGALRERVALPPAVLQLQPMNGTFERKVINVPYQPDVLRIGRQTNQKTVPTPSNGYFDSKVLSRQHAEIYADANGRIFIRDVKSSNGTFVNGMRLSQENKESEPRELREHDVLELGIDIVSEDQKTVVHHKVAAKVEHAGLVQQGNDLMSFESLDPSAGPAPNFMGPQQLRRSGSQGSLNGRLSANLAAPPAATGLLALQQQPQYLRNWLNPITTEQIVKKLNNETRFAEQQSAELRKVRNLVEKMIGGKVEPITSETKPGSEKVKFSPTKSKIDTKTHFSEPPAPPPQAPLPEKPDVARALADPIIQPLLRRSDTARPGSASSSPTRSNHSSDILRLCEELKLAKGELSNRDARMKTLESQLAQERTARESAEERAQRLEQADRRDSPTNDGHPSAENSPRSTPVLNSADLQIQLDRLRSTMDEMKQQMEIYKRRAETAESERDDARSSLEEMIGQKRRENAEIAMHSGSSPGSVKSAKSSSKKGPKLNGKTPIEANGHALAPSPLSSPTSEILLRRAGIEEGQPITEEQARIMTQVLMSEVLGPQHKGDADRALLYYGLPYGSFAAVVVLGYIAMTWVNGWPKIER